MENIEDKEEKKVSKKKASTASKVKRMVKDKISSKKEKKEVKKASLKTKKSVFKKDSKKDNVDTEIDSKIDKSGLIESKSIENAKDIDDNKKDDKKLGKELDESKKEEKKQDKELDESKKEEKKQDKELYESKKEEKKYGKELDGSKKEENKQEDVLDESKKELKRKTKSVKKEKLEFNLLEVIIIIIITVVFVAFLTGLLIYNNYDKIIGNTTGVESSNEFSEFESSYYDIINNYAGEVNKEELIDAAISGMYNYLGDSYSYYIDKDSNDTLQDTLNGEYEGIGVEITSVYSTDGTYKTYISKVFADSPAEKAGLKVGDVFVSLNGVDLSDKNSAYVADIIKNGAQTDNTIVVSRDGENITLNVKREHVYIDSVKSEIKDGVGYIQIDTFSLTTANLVKKAIDSFDTTVKSLIIDLRDNGGGYTISAYDTANLFIENGKNIYQLEDKNGSTTAYKASGDVYRKFEKIAVIVNEESASSAEILALALRESAGAIIVGTKSYGKGTVQDTKQLSSGAMVKYTIGYWLSPNGNSINEIGITPDIVEEDINNQINKAIEAVK